MFEKRMDFVQPDLHVYYINDRLDKRHKTASTYYYILILLQGTCKINYQNSIYIAKPNDVHIANRAEEFTVEYNNNPAEFIEIWVASKLLHEFDKNYNLIKPFYDSNKIKVLNSETNTPEFNIGVKNLIRALRERSSRAFVLTSVLQLICELNYIYDKKQPFIIKETDSNYAKIISYIDNNLFEKITLKAISENLFISEKCICENIKKISGLTFHELISEKRFLEARNLIYTTDEPLNKIAERCGFDTYSTFYRGYLKYFGITPKEEQLSKNKHL